MEAMYLDESRWGTNESKECWWYAQNDVPRDATLRGIMLDWTQNWKRTRCTLYEALHLPLIVYHVDHVRFSRKEMQHTDNAVITVSLARWDMWGARGETHPSLFGGCCFWTLFVACRRNRRLCCVLCVIVGLSIFDTFWSTRKTRKPHILQSTVYADGAITGLLIRCSLCYDRLKLYETLFHKLLFGGEWKRQPGDHARWRP